MCSTSSDPRQAAAARAQRAGSRAAKQSAESGGKATAESSSGGGGGLLVYGITGVISAMSFFVYDYFNNPKLAFVAGTPFEGPFRGLLEWSRSISEEPFSEKLIPDYPTDPYYAADDSPPGTPPRILLVLDVEKTIFGLEHDARYGWRYFKRPGLEQFLKQLAPYFEIVLHYESDNSIEAVQTLVGEMQMNAFILGPGSAQQELDGTLVKRLDLMNRPMSRIILIDDDEGAAKKFPRNTLYVGSYDDPKQTDDTTLLDLIPMLQSLVHYAADDVRDVFDDMGSHDAVEASTEYRRRVWQAKQAGKDKRNRGLGKFIRSAIPDEETLRSRKGSVLDLLDQEEATTSNTGIFSKKDDKIGLPGDKKAKTAPVGKKRTGGLFTWVKDQEQQKAEVEMARREKTHQIMVKRQQEAAEKEARESYVKCVFR